MFPFVESKSIFKRFLIEVWLYWDLGNFSIYLVGIPSLSAHEYLDKQLVALESLSLFEVSLFP